MKETFAIFTSESNLGEMKSSEVAYKVPSLGGQRLFTFIRTILLYSQLSQPFALVDIMPIMKIRATHSNWLMNKL